MKDNPIIAYCLVVLTVLGVVWFISHYRDQRVNKNLNTLRKPYVTNQVRWEKAISSKGPILLDHQTGTFYLE